MHFAINFFPQFSTRSQILIKNNCKMWLQWFDSLKKHVTLFIMLGFLENIYSLQNEMKQKVNRRIELVTRISTVHLKYNDNETIEIFSGFLLLLLNSAHSQFLIILLGFFVMRCFLYDFMMVVILIGLFQNLLYRITLV